MRINFNKFGKGTLFFMVFFLLYYIYMSPVRKVFLPRSDILVPAMLVASMVLAALYSKGLVIMRGKADIVQCFSWIAIILLMTLYNEDLPSNIVKGGMIQQYTVVVIMLLAAGLHKYWIKYWLYLTEAFVLIHAVATIYFYNNAGAYDSFIRKFYDPDQVKELLDCYERGWMCGLCSHFSTNGMILAVGLIIAVFLLFNSFKLKEHRVLRVISVVILAALGLIFIYALILSSKRGPLFAAVIGISVTFVMANGKHIVRRLIILAAVITVVYLAYEYLLTYIPGLSTLSDKAEKLESSNAGLLNGREGLWNRALSMFRSNPLFGHGYGSFSKYANETNAITTSAHNYYLQVLAEYGIFGMTLYLTAFISSLINTFMVLFECGRRNLAEETMFVSVSAAVQIFTLAYSVTSTSLMYYQILVPLFLAYAATRTIKFELDPVDARGRLESRSY